MLLVDVLEPTLGMVLKNFILQGRLDTSNQCCRIHFDRVYQLLLEHQCCWWMSWNPL